MSPELSASEAADFVLSSGDQLRLACVVDDEGPKVLLTAIDVDAGEALLVELTPTEVAEVSHFMRTASLDATRRYWDQQTPRP